MGPQVVFYHIVVTHAQGLCHHAVDFLTLVNGLLHTDTDQTTQQERDEPYDDSTHDNKDGDG